MIALAMGLYALVLIMLYGSLQESWVNLKIIWHRVVTISKHLGAEEGVEGEAARVNRRRLIPFAAMVACGIIALLFKLSQERAVAP
jgi:hypothetical protein